MTQGQRPQAEFCLDAPAQIIRWIGVVIASDPNPISASGQFPDLADLVIAKTASGSRIVETVAQTNNQCRIVPSDKRFEVSQCRQRIIGRQQRAAFGERRTLFEMQVGDKQRPTFGPEQAARWIRV